MNELGTRAGAGQLPEGAVTREPSGEKRGPLEVQVEVSSRDVLAGNDFAIFVIVRNPFSRPIWVESVFVTKPSELVSSSSRGENTSRLKQLRRDLAKQEESREKRTQKVLNGLNDLKVAIRAQNSIDASIFDRLDEIQNSLSAETKFGLRTKHLRVGRLELDSHDADIRTESAEIERLIVRSPLARSVRESVLNEVELESSLPPGAALQSGSTVVYRSVLCVSSPLFFTPTSFRLQFSVNYSLDDPDEAKTNSKDQLFSNSVSHTLLIRPSVFSVMTGAACGGFAGALSLTLQLGSVANLQFSPTISGLFLSVMLSVIAAIFLARKSEAQSFVSVEDFWGGLLIGFFVGYAGTSFFEQIVGLSANASG